MNKRVVVDNATFCWIDLEMTGLDADRDKILEVAALVTDAHLNTIFNGLVAIVHYDKDQLPTMNKWVLNQHTQSGLLAAVEESKLDIASADDFFYTALSGYCSPEDSYIAGNSVYQDKAFLKRHMPRLDSLFNYRIIDVSSIKVLINLWYKDDPSCAFIKNKEHRALRDIYESIAELKHYKEHFFKN